MGDSGTVEVAANPNAVPDVQDPDSMGRGLTNSRPGTGLSPSRPGTGKIWNTEGDQALDDLNENEAQSMSSMHSEEGLSDEDTKILLEKEFDDYYEDRVHKSAGPVVFVSKCLGMLPVIWTEDEDSGECKTYFNMYTFLVVIGWIGMAVLAGYRIDSYSSFPSNATFTAANSSMAQRFMGRMPLDTYSGAIFLNALVAVIFGVFKAKSFADVLFLASGIDSQLELKEKNYEKLKTKTLFWLVLLLLLTAAHGVGIFFLMEDYGRDIILFCCFILAHLVISVLDLQYIHMCMLLCKRYRMLNKIITLIVKPFKTFRCEEPSNEMLQKILSYRWEKKEEARNTFDQIWQPEVASVDLPDTTSKPLTKTDYSKEDVPAAIWMKDADKEISREEENTVILQLDILRSIHSDLHQIGQEINELLGFQMLINLIINIIIIVMFGFFLSSSCYDGNFYWPFAVIIISPLFRILYIGHWAQVLKDTSEKPFWCMSQMSTLDGSPRLERQVQKCLLQTSQQTAVVTASGYFTITRNTITRVFGMILIFVFLLVKFDRLERRGM